MTIEVLKPGLSTTVQDLGRPGYYHLGIPVSGISILAIMIEPGAVMMIDVNRCLASAPNRMYTAIRPAEMCAIPEVITVSSSDCVISGRYGRIISGASVWLRPAHE